MNRILFFLGFLLAQSSFAQIKFEQAVIANPLVVEVVKSYCSGSICYFYDKNDIIRLTTMSGSYSLRNSANEEISLVTAAEETVKMAARPLINASVTCPGKIYIERSTIKIFDTRSSCSVGGVATLNLNKKYLQSGTLYLYDSADSIKLIFWEQKYYINYGATALNKNYDISATELAKFQSFVKSARSDCPLKVDYNEQTGEILKMKSGCDPLAAIDDGSRNG